MAQPTARQRAHMRTHQPRPPVPMQAFTANPNFDPRWGPAGPPQAMPVPVPVPVPQPQPQGRQRRPLNNPFNDMPLRKTGSAAVFSGGGLPLAAMGPGAAVAPLAAYGLGNNYAQGAQRVGEWFTGAQGGNESRLGAAIRQDIGRDMSTIGGALRAPIDAYNWLTGALGGEASYWGKTGNEIAADGRPQPAARPGQAPQPQQARVAPPPKVNPFAAFAASPGQGIGVSRDGGARKHTGRDYSGVRGQHIPAGMNGRVVDFGQQGKLGKFVTVQYDDKTTHTYGHLEGMRGGLQRNQRLSPGEVFAFAGASGNAQTSRQNGAVLHVTARDAKGKLIDPQAWASGGVAGSGGVMPVSQDALGGLGPIPGAPNAPNAPDFSGQIGATYDRLGQLAQDQYQAAITPTEARFTESPKPEAPVRPDFAKTDFAAGDAAFEAARPKNPFGDTPEDQEKYMLKQRRQGWMRGMADAVMGTNPNSHLGQILFRMGAGGIGGSVDASDKIEQKREQFEGKLAQFNLALSQRNDQKAQTLATELNREIEFDHRDAMQQFGLAMQDWARNNDFSMDGQGNVISRRRDPNTNEIVIKRQPSESAAAMQLAMTQARLAEGELGSLMGAQQWTYSQNVNDMYRAFGAQLQVRDQVRQETNDARNWSLVSGSNNPENRDEIAMAGIGMTLANMTEDGSWRNTFPPHIIQGIDTELASNPQFTTLPGQTPTREQQQARNAFIMQRLNAATFSSPFIQRKLIESMTTPGLNAFSSNSAAMGARRREGSVTQRTDARGRTSVSERY